MENQQSPPPPDGSPSLPPSGEPPRPPSDLWSRRRWFSRLSFSFLIVAVWLAYSAYKGTDLSFIRKSLMCVGAGVAFLLFLMATKERHRPEE